MRNYSGYAKKNRVIIVIKTKVHANGRKCWLDLEFFFNVFGSIISGSWILALGAISSRCWRQKKNYANYKHIAQNVYFYNHWWKIQLHVAIQFIISIKCGFSLDDLDSSVDHGVIDAKIRRRHKRDFDLWLWLTTAYTRVYFIFHKTLKICIFQNFFPFWRSYSTAATI